MTFAGRYPPTDPVKHEHFLAERKWWLDWRQTIPNTIYTPRDGQETFYKFVRFRLELDADDYDQRIGDIIQAWQVQRSLVLVESSE